MKMKSLERQGIFYGGIVTVFLIAFFLLMKSFGLIHNFNLRIFNSLFLFSGIFLAIRNLKSKNQGDLNYLSGLGLGLITSLVAAILFSLFVFSYVNLDPAFMTSIKENEPQGIYLNEFGVLVLIFIEAFASGLLFTYASMQYFKSEQPAAL